MLLILLLNVFLISITYVYLRWRQLKQYWAKRGVPHNPPHPIFGSFTFLFKENPTMWFRRMYDCFKEPYVGIWIFWRPAIVVNSPEVAKNILIKHQVNFRNRFATSGTTDPVGRYNLFMLNDPLWTVIRRRLTTLFTNSKLRGVENILAQKSKELVQRIETDRKKLSPIDIRNMMIDYTTDVMGTLSFGVVCDAVLTGTSHIKRVNLMVFNIFRGLSWCCGFFIPELADLFRFKIFPVESMECMRKMLRGTIAQRGGLENKVIEPRDFLDILIKIKQECGEELDMSENMMLAQVAIFLQGGFDTTATAITFIIYELAFKHEVQEKLYRELHEAKNKHDDDLFNANVLAPLPYLNCVINEGLRKYPVISWLDRVALEDYKVDDHLTIKAGTPVYVNTVGMHYDPQFFPEPDVFNPDRFLLDNNPVKNLPGYMPFGEGPRKCIGQRLGLSSLRYAIATIMVNYEVKPLANSLKPLDIKLEKNSLLNVPNQILSVEFVRRKNIQIAQSTDH